jgi:hypothetical protein
MPQPSAMDFKLGHYPRVLVSVVARHRNRNQSADCFDLLALGLKGQDFLVSGFTFRRAGAKLSNGGKGASWEQ